MEDCEKALAEALEEMIKLGYYGQALMLLEEVKETFSLYEEYKIKAEKGLSAI